MAGMGFDAAMIASASDDVKARIGWIAYVLGGAKALTFPARRFEISVDGAPFTKHRARAVMVGNVGSLQAGMPLMPDAEIDDGVIDALLLYPQRLLSWVPVAFRLLSPHAPNDELVTRLRGSSIVIKAGVDTPRQLDGDLVPPGREFQMR